MPTSDDRVPGALRTGLIARLLRFRGQARGIAPEHAPERFPMSALSTTGRRGFRALTHELDTLEPRQLFNAAFDLIDLTELRQDPLYASIDGSGVSVAVIDTGVDASHPDLRPGFLGGADFTDDGVRFDQDFDGHGTHVAGTVAARNRRLGVAPAAGIIGLQVLDPEGNGNLNRIGDAIRWAIANQDRYNIRVINMSLGARVNVVSDSGLLPSVTSAIRDAERRGITVISAAGNEYARYQVQGVSYPAITSTISVGAVWPSNGSSAFADDLANFSQRLDFAQMLFAPGVNIESTWPGSRTNSISGTSMASPMVAGIAALMQDAAQTFAGRYLTPAETRDILLASSVRINDIETTRDNVRNSGLSYQRVNAQRAVQLVRERLAPDAPPPPPPDPGDNIPADPTGTRQGALIAPARADGSIDFITKGKVGFDTGNQRVGPRDVDVFRINAANAGTLRITLATDAEEAADFDSYLRLFDAEGREIAVNDDISAANRFSALEREVPAGTYYAAITGKGNQTYALDVLNTRADGTQGNYSLTLTLTTGTGGDRDGSIARATLILPGSGRSPTTINAALGTDDTTAIGAGDVDFFTLSVPDDGFLLLDIDSMGSTWSDTFLRLFDASGLQLAFSDDEAARNPFNETIERALSDGRMINIANSSAAGRGSDSFIRLAVRRGQTFFIGVSTYENRMYNPADPTAARNTTGAQGAYTLIAQFSSNDVNGSIDSAVIGGGFPGGNEGAIGFDQGTLVTGDKDVDFFVIRPTTAGLMIVDVDSSNGWPENDQPFDPVLYAFDANGKLLGVNDDFSGLDPRLVIRVQSGQSYYFAVTGYGNEGFDPWQAGSGSGGDTGRYRVAWALTSANDFAIYADDSTQFTGITPVTAGDQLDVNLGTDGPLIVGSRDVDLYRFTADADGFLAVYALGENAFDADAVVRLFDNTGSPVSLNVDSSIDGSTDNFLLARVTRGQTYLIGISGAGPAALNYNARIFGSAGEGSTGNYILSVGFGTERPTLAGLNAQRLTTPNGIVTAVRFTPGTIAPPAGAAVDSVAYFLDFNRDGNFGAGELIATDDDPSNGFDYDFSVDTRWAPGGYLLGTVAIDSNGVPSSLQTRMFDIRPALAYRAFYPEGWANERTIDQFIPLVNPNNAAARYIVLAHYERRAADAGAPLSIVVAEGEIAALSRGGVSITTRAGIGRSLVELERGYALEVQSTLPLGAVLAHYDNFNPNAPDAGVATGEALTTFTARSWFFPTVNKNPGTNFEFILVFNPNDTAVSVTMTFLRDGGEAGSITFPVYGHNRWGYSINDLAIIPNGVYGVRLDSSGPIVVALSAYTTDGRGDSSIGQPGETGFAPGAPSTSGTFPFIDRTANLTAELSFLNPGTSATDITLIASNARGDTATTVITLAAGTTIRPSLLFAANLTGDAIQIRYTSTAPVAGWVTQNSAARGDSTFYPAVASRANSWAIADAYLNRSLVGTRYFENFSVANPNDTETRVSIDFLLYDHRGSGAIDGRSQRVTREFTIAPRSFLSIPVHAADSPVVTNDNRPEVHFSIVARGSQPIQVIFTHWDLTQGGGWDTWATPLPEITG
jgi:subtilisin family serine protease